MTFRRSLALSLALATCLLGRTSRAEETPRAESEGTPPETLTETVERCSAEHERARLLRLQEQWLEARAAMSACAAESCPLALRADCNAWLDDLAQTLPSLLIVVERDQRDERPVSVEIDGRRVIVEEPARAIEMLPGQHRLRFELSPYSPVEQTIVLEKGQKNRVVRVKFEASDPAPAPARPAFDYSLPPEPSRPVPPLTYALGAGTILALGTASALFVSAYYDDDRAEDLCSPNCGSEARESIETRLTLADVFVGAGIVLGGLTLYTFVDRPVVMRGQTSASPTFSLRSSGTDVVLRGAF